MVILGNKCDLENSRQVATNDGKAYAAKNQAPFFEVSAKGNTNVQQAFEQVIKDTYEMKKEKFGNSKTSVDLSKGSSGKKKDCCKK